jgi:hypothetical protein
MHAQIADGVVIETIGEAVMVMVPGATDFISLTGDAARLVREVRAGLVASPSRPALAELIGLGILAIPPGMSRRGLIAVGAIGASAGIAVMAMPHVAAAASVQRIAIKGTYKSGRGLYGAYWFFDISTNSGLGDESIPQPAPSNNESDISPLLIKGVSVPVGYSDLDGEGVQFVVWEDERLTSLVPAVEETGEFAWTGADGIVRHYLVTFRGSWST